jgi:Zn-dependent protease
MDFVIDISTIVQILICLLIGLTLHEMMHAFVGLKLGDTTAHEEGRISLNPLRHIDPFATVLLPIITLVLFHAPILAAKPVPFNPERVKWDEFGAALIALAGPLTNLVLAAIGGLLAHVFAANVDVFNFLSIFVFLNVGLFVFNMVPIPPLDGSRVLFACAPEALQRIMAELEQFGIFIVFGLVLLVPAFGQILININRAISLFFL